MTQRILWWVGTALLIILIVALYAFSGPGQQTRVAAVMTGFGGTLQQVSLLASSTDVTTAMQTSYAGYVSPDLLAQWETSPMQAPGRLTSSPWPDRILVNSMAKQSDGSYDVQGTLVEKTSTGDAGTFPVTATVRQMSGRWLITAFSGYPPQEIPATGAVSIDGTMVCLPHKDMSGPQTLECAIGLEDGQGRYFALDETALGAPGPSDIATGKQVRVEGTFTPRTDSLYQDIGVIKVTSITALDDMSKG